MKILPSVDEIDAHRTQIKYKRNFRRFQKQPIT